MAAKLFHALAGGQTEKKTKDLGNELAASANFSHFMPIKWKCAYVSCPSGQSGQNGPRPRHRPRTATAEIAATFSNDKLAAGPRAKVSLDAAKMSVWFDHAVLGP